MYWIFTFKPLFAVQTIDNINSDYYQRKIYDYKIKPRLDWCTIILRVLMGGEMGSRNNPFNNNFMDPNVVISSITILENVFAPPGLWPRFGCSYTHKCNSDFIFEGNKTFRKRVVLYSF